MSKGKIILLIILGAIVALLLFSSAILPGLIRSKAVALFQEETGRKTKIENISFNPLTLTLQVKGLVLEETGGGPFFFVKTIRVSVSPSSIYRRALVVSSLSIETPFIHIVREKAGHFNFSDILKKHQKEAAPGKSGIFPFILNNFRLVDGSLAIDDHAVPDGRSHSVKKLEMTLPRFSSLPKDAGEKVLPHIFAIINGAPFTLDGKTTPFSNDKASSLHITLQQLNLPELAAYIPHTPPIDLQSGKLTIDADIFYRQPLKSEPDLSFKGLTRLDDLQINLSAGNPLLRIHSLDIAATSIKPLAGVFGLEKINISGMELFVSRNRQGRWMYENLVPYPAAPAPGVKTVPKPSFSLASLKLRDGCIHFRDDLPGDGFSATAGDINLDLKNVASNPEQTGNYGISFNIDRDVGVTSNGKFNIQNSSVNIDLQIAGLPLRKGWPYLSQYLTTPLGGIVDLSGKLAFDEKNGLTANKVCLIVKDFSARYGKQEGIDLKLLAINGADYYQKAGKLAVEQIKLSGGNVSLALGEDGRISAQALLRAQDHPGENRAGAVKVVGEKPDHGEKTVPFAYHVKRLAVDKTKIAFTDMTRILKPCFTLSDTKITLADLEGPSSTPARFDFSTIWGIDSTIEARGNITLSPLGYRGRLQIGHLPISDFEAYYPENFNFHILGGLLDTTMDLDIALTDTSPEVSFRGNAGISSFHATDAVENDDLLKWQRLQLDKIDGGTKPFRLAIGDVSLNEPYACIIIRKNGTLNLQELFRTEARPLESPAPATTGSAEAQAREKPPDVRVDNVTMLNGTISFTDKYLPNDFVTTLYKLGGRISGLSSEASIMADVDLRGNLENHSPMMIKGKINPLRDDLFVDLRLSFSDIDLSPMSPYSETYLGYILKQGKLFLDLEYHIENKKLISENRIMVDQFTFGNKVESDRATSLPVKLGVALLRDNRGEIHLDVPVTGRIDDPRFSVWRIVFQVIKNLLVKAVTAPFSLLSSLFGGGNDLSLVGFSPGSSALQPEEEKKLISLARGLAQRPSLKMSVSAYVDPEGDVEAYRKELFSRKLKREKILALARKQRRVDDKGENETNILPEERSQYLKLLYAGEKFPKPLDAAGKEAVLPDAEMTKLILTNIKVENDELENLARERSAAVLQFLIDRGKIPAERIFLQKVDIFKKPEKKETPRGRVELDAIP